MLLSNFSRNYTYKYNYIIFIMRNEYNIHITNNHVYNVSITCKCSMNRPKYNKYDYLDLDFSLLSTDYVDICNLVNDESWD